MLIEGMQGQGPTGAGVAKRMGDAWLATCFDAYNNTGYMYEKYNAFEFGVGGGGGEYVPQVGFGWSNGVVLSILNQSYESIPSPFAL
jgi:alpha,alpha-trehalase